MLDHLAMGDPLAGMFTAVEPGTGHVLAMSVNRRFGYDVNDPTQESVALNVEASQGAGSTYKVFVAASALEKGIPPWNTITTSDPYTSRVYKKLGGTVGAPYVVQNAGQYPPTLTMVEALVRSSNTYFVALEDQLGSVEGPVRMAQRMGLFSIDPVADEVIADRRGSFTLGAEATSPLALASAYSTLGANGTQCNPTPVIAVLDRAGAPLTGADGAPLDTDVHCKPEAMPPAVATTLNQILVGDVASSIGTGTRAAIPGHTIAGKTGTSQDRFSVAFVGYTPKFAASVMVLNPKHNQDVGAYGGRRGGADLARRDAADPVRAARRALPAGGHRARATAAPAGAHVPTAEPAPRPRPDAAAPGRPAAGRAAAGRAHRGPQSVREPEHPVQLKSGHELGGALPDHHRRGRRPAGGHPGQHRGVHDPQPGYAAHPQLLVDDGTRIRRRAHPAVPERWTAVVRCSTHPAVEGVVVVEHGVAAGRPSGDQGGEGRQRQQVRGQPHALAQPSPVGLLGQVAVGQPRLPRGSPGRDSVDRGRPARWRPTPTTSSSSCGSAPPPVMRLNGVSHGRTSRSPGAAAVDDVACSTPCSGSRGVGSGRAGR